MMKVKMQHSDISCALGYVVLNKLQFYPKLVPKAEWITL